MSALNLARCFTLNSSRLRISPLQRSDITEAYVETLNDKNYMAFSNQRFLDHDIESCLEYQRKLLDTGGALLACREISTADLVATISVHPERNHGRVDLGLLVLRSFVGMGFGTEAWCAVVDCLKVNPTVRKLTAGTVETNGPMRAIIEKSGFKLECRRPGHELINQRPVDLLYYCC